MLADNARHRSEKTQAAGVARAGAAFTVEDHRV
jgi:hypothetical protein